MEVLDERCAQAQTADDFIAGLVTTLDEMVSEDPGFVIVVFELFTLSRRHEDIAAGVTAVRALLEDPA